MFLRVDLCRRSLWVAIPVGIVKESQFVFRFEDQPAGAVDVGDFDAPRSKRTLQCGKISFADHIHVHSGLECACRNLLQVSDTVGLHLHDPRIVRYHEASETPLVTQYVCHQPFIGRCGDSVHLVERGHDAAYTRVDSGLVGREIFVVHALAAHVRRVVVAAGFRGTVKSVVLYAAQDFVGRKM